MLRFALRNLWRDLKSGELSVLLLALSVAVLSLTAVGFFTNRIAQGVRAQAAEVLAADLRLESPRPIPREIFREEPQARARERRAVDLPHGDLQRRREPARGAQRGDARVIRCAAASRSPHTPFGAASVTDRIPGARRGLGGRPDRRASGHRARRFDPHRRRPRFGSRKFSTIGRIRARDSSIWRRPCSSTTTTCHRPSSSSPAAASPTRPCSRAPAAAVAALRDFLSAAKSRRRATARSGRVEPAAELRHRPRQPVPEPGESRLGAAGRGRRGHGRAALRGPAHRHRGVDEVHGSLAALRAVDLGDRAHAARAGRGRRRRLDGILRAKRARLAAARSHPHRSAAGLARSAGRGAGDRDRDADRLRAALAPASEEHAARPRAAQDGDGAAAQIRHRLPVRGGRAVRDSLEPGARYRARGERARRRARRRRRAGACRLRPRAADRAAARRRRRRVAIWARQCVAARRRERGADRGVRARAHDAVAARGRARRPVGGLAAEPAEPMCPTIFWSTSARMSARRSRIS